MDALKAYESESENSDEDESHTGDKDSVVNDIKRDSVRNSTFGLLNSEVDYPIRKDTQAKNTESVKRTVKLETESVDLEIPGSSFWKEATQLDLQVLQKQQFEKDERHGVEFKRYGKRSCGDKFISGRQNTKIVKLHDESKSRNKSSADTEGKSEDLTSKRKIFFVHQNVKPYLHGRNTPCRIPSAVQWTNPAHAGATNRIKWNVPTFSHLLVTCSMDTTVKIWNVWSHLDPCVQILRSHDRAVKDIDWSHTGRQLLSSSYDKSAVITDVETGSVVHRLQHSSYVTCGRYHPVDPQMCVTGCNNQILVWDTRSPTSPSRSLTYKDNFGQVQDIAFSSNSTELFSCSDLVSRDSADRNLMAWDLATGVTLSNQIYQERFTLTRLRVHPTEQHLLAQSQGNYITIFSLLKPYKMNKHKRFDGHKVQGYSVGFDVSPDGQTVYSASSDGKLYCYNNQSGRLYRTIQTGFDVVLDVACHPVLHSTVAVSAWDGSVQVWK